MMQMAVDRNTLIQTMCDARRRVMAVIP